MDTAALRTAACCGSVTFPTRLPYNTCAEAEPPVRPRTASTKRPRRIADIAKSPLDWIDADRSPRPPSAWDQFYSRICLSQPPGSANEVNRTIDPGTVPHLDLPVRPKDLHRLRLGVTQPEVGAAVA